MSDNLLEMKKKLILLCGMLGVLGVVTAQSLIKTVQCYPVGKPFAEPVIELGSGQQLIFSFDDLSQ